MAKARSKKSSPAGDLLFLAFTLIIAYVPFQFMGYAITEQNVARRLHARSERTTAYITRLDHAPKRFDVAHYYFTVLNPKGEPQTFYRMENISDDDWWVLFRRDTDSVGRRQAEVVFAPADPTISRLIIDGPPEPPASTLGFAAMLLLPGGLGVLILAFAVKQAVALLRRSDLDAGKKP